MCEAASPFRARPASAPPARGALLDPPRDHLASLRPRRRDHALALHALDHARGAVVADAQAALQPGDRRLAVLGDEPHRHVVHLVGQVLAVLALALLVVAALEQRHLVARLLLALDEVDHVVDVAVRDEGAVQALDARRAGRQEEHVALAAPALAAARGPGGARGRATS